MAEFTDCFEDLFDIAQADAVDMITAEDKDFLDAQQEKGHIRTMSSVDTVLIRKEQKHQEKFAKEQEHQMRSNAEADQLHEQVILDSGSSSADEEADTSYQYPDSSRKSPPRTKQSRQTRHVPISVSILQPPLIITRY